MWFNGDPADVMRTEEQRWDTIRALAEKRRLARSAPRPAHRGQALSRAHRFLGHMSSLVASRVRPAEPKRELDGMSDAEVVRLLALLVSPTDVLPLEGAASVPSIPEDERCASGF